jgi:dipeptidyl aminopeptidase/acylaminoacyl peptidase
MRRASWLHAICVLAVLSAPAGAGQTAAPSAFTVEELLKLSRVSDPRLSPDGAHVAYVVTEVSLGKNSRSNHMWIVPVMGGEPVAVARSDKSDDTPRWSPDGRRLACVSTRDGGSQIWVIGVAAGGHPSGDPRKLTSLSTDVSGLAWSPDGRWILTASDVFPACDSVACNDGTLKEFDNRPSKAHVFDELLFRHWTSWKDGRFTHLYLVSADGSAPPRDLTPGRADVPPFSLGGPDDYAFSPDSKEIAYAQKTDPVEAISTNSDLFVLDLAVPGAKPRKITQNPAADGGPAYSPDGRFLAYRAQKRAGFESDRWELMLFDRKTEEHRSLTAAFDRSADSYVWAPDSQSIDLLAEDQGRVAAYRLAVAGGPPAILPIEGSVSDLQISRDAKALVFARSTLSEPVEIYRAAADGSNVQRVTNVSVRAVSDFKLRAAESVVYEGASGARVQAWILKPPGFSEHRRYPLLYLVHGGPQGSWADSWGYRWNPQVFASAGYVVFMPNPRGSTGFGQQFTDEISGDWGGKVFEDLMKGADYAEGLPYVDRSRVGAAGASYGGYMMNWFLGHTDRFKAIVTHAGVYNLTSMYGATEELWFPEWDLKGTPWANPESYDRWSPHRYAKNFKTPTLVTHGEIDFRVPIGEGLQLFTTLRRQGVPAKMVSFPDEGHWINKPANSAVWYHAFIDWMDRWVSNAGR